MQPANVIGLSEHDDDDDDDDDDDVPQVLLSTLVKFNHVGCS